MGNKNRQIIAILIIVFTLNSCDKFRVKDIFVTDETINERFEQSMKWNNNHPVKNITVETEEYSFFISSDIHVGETVNLTKFAKLTNEANVDAAIFVGDLTLAGHEENYKDFEQTILKLDSIEVFSIVGNHDLFFDGWKYFYSYFGSSCYIFTVKTPNSKDLYICLDTGGGTLGDKQLDWLKNTLKNERNKYRYCSILTHNNLLRIRHTTSTNLLVEELQTILDLSIKYNINTIITGHDHEKYIETIGNTTHLSLDALLDGYENAGYLKLTVNSNKIDYDFIDIQ